MTTQTIEIAAYIKQCGDGVADYPGCDDGESNCFFTFDADGRLTAVRLAGAQPVAPVAQQEFKATAARIVYRPKRGRKGLMYITSWMPLGDFPPNVAEVLEETTLYERKAAPQGEGK